MPPPPMRPLWNRLVNRAEQALGRARLVSRPAVVDVVLTKACNLACTFCRDYEQPGARKVTVEQLESVATQLFPTARRLNVCSGGEPYLHTGLEHLLALARSHGLHTWVLSNGMLLERGRLEGLLDRELISEHGFSVDGLSAATVEALRTGAHLPTILANIEMLLGLREQRGGGAPEVVIRYALMRRNLDELPEAVAWWGERGVERLDCGYLNLANGMDREQSLYFHQEAMLAVFERARRVAERYPGLRLSLPPSVAEEQALADNPRRCSMPWDFVMIDASGKLLPCYRAFEALQMGALHGDDARPFDELWNSPGYQALRRTVNDDGAAKHYPFCRVCERRRGWGQADSHLGDETWQKLAFADPELGATVDHRRAGFRSLERWDAEHDDGAPDHGPPGPGAP